MKKMSVKQKITLWYTAFMAAFAVLSLLILLFFANSQALSGTQLRLKDAVEKSFQEIEYDDGVLLFDDDINFLGDGIYLSVYNREGALIYGRIPSDFYGASTLIMGQLQQVKSDGHRWYVYDSLQEIEGYGSLWVRGVISQSPADSSLRAVSLCALILFPFFVLFTALGGYSIIRRALLPLETMTETAERIGSADDLSLRLNLESGADEVYRLAHTFDGMMERLQTSFEREKQFSSDVSHELRTPLSVILSQSEYALSPECDCEDRTAALQSIRRQGLKMSALIAQLLTLARAESGRLALQPELIDVSELASMVCEEQQETAASKKISIHTSIAPGLCAEADETMLIRFFINLISNAIAYGKEGGSIRVSLKASQPSDTSDASASPGTSGASNVSGPPAGRRAGICGSVRDDGIGISAEHLDKIWNRFYQVDPARSSGSAEGSSGLGLSMVRWIVQAHGGSIRVSSTPGEGTEFTFFFPFSKNEDF
ncbi:MAG: ATP-binding protein [Eubacteriales bacterium]|nr:ATP-binding protein [Eubacteriales bacterium]